MSIVLSNVTNREFLFNKINKILPGDLVNRETELNQFDRNVEKTVTNFLISKKFIGKDQDLESVDKDQLDLVIDWVFIPLIEEVKEDGWVQTLDVISQVFGGRLFNHSEYVDMDLGKVIGIDSKQKKASAQQNVPVVEISTQKKDDVQQNVPVVEISTQEKNSVQQIGSPQQNDAHTDNDSGFENKQLSSFFLDKLQKSTRDKELTELITDLDLIGDVDTSNTKLGEMIDPLLEDKKWAKELGKAMTEVIDLLKDDDDLCAYLDCDEFYDLVGNILKRAATIDDKKRQKAHILNELDFLNFASSIFPEELFESAFEEGLSIREKFMKSLSQSTMLFDDMRDIIEDYEDVLNVAGNPNTDFFDKIEKKRKQVDEKIKDEFVKSKILDVIDTIAVSYLLVQQFREDCDKHPKELMDLISNIIEYQNPNQRELFIKHLLDKIYSAEVDQSVRPNCITALKDCSSKRKRIPTMLLSSLKGVSVSDTKKIVDSLCISADKKRQKDINSCLYSIVNSRGLNSNQKLKILNAIIGKLENVQLRKDKEQLVLENLNAVKALVDLQQFKNLIESDANADFSKMLEKVFASKFDVSGIDNPEKKYIDTIGQFRNPIAVYTLLSSLKKLTNKEMPLEYYNQFVRSLLTGSFHKNRYDITKNKHLEAVFGNNKELLQKWQKGHEFEEDNIKVVDTDDPEDIMLCGTEVIGSCLHINSSMSWGELGNYEYLLAHLLNGQVRMVATKNPVTNKLQSRCMIRILLDENNQPVLFQEGVYGFHADEELLDKMCEARAKELGIPLVRYKDKERKKRFIRLMRTFAYEGGITSA